ncbi:MAG: HAD-IB family hydrolase [Gammaproteobacteria bacterium]|jgi:HAD superfamily hydrolase (TIGR01490 family)
MGLAVFDIDGTLVAGPSTEKRFFLRLLRRGLIGPGRLFAFLFFNLRWLPRYGRHVAKKNKAYLAGIDARRLDAEARAFVAEEVLPALYAPAVARLQRHRAAGDAIVLLSGTLQPIADELARRLGVPEAIGSLCEEREGRLTAGPPSRHPFGEAKRAMLGELCNRYATDAEDVSAYGDSIYDLPLLEVVGQPVAVRPDKQLQRVAADRGWEALASGIKNGMGGASRDTV